MVSYLWRFCCTQKYFCLEKKIILVVASSNSDIFQITDFIFLYSPNSEIVVRIRLGFIFCIIQIIVSAVLLLLHSCRTTRMWSHTLLAHLNHLSQFVARSNYFPFFDVGGRLIWNVSQAFIWSSTDQEVSNIEYQKPKIHFKNVIPFSRKSDGSTDIFCRKG